MSQHGRELADSAKQEARIAAGRAPPSSSITSTLTNTCDFGNDSWSRQSIISIMILERETAEYTVELLFLTASERGYLSSRKKTTLCLIDDTVLVSSKAVTQHIAVCSSAEEPTTKRRQVAQLQQSCSSLCVKVVKLLTVACEQIAVTNMT